MWLRPIRPNNEALVKIRKDKFQLSPFARDYPWMVLTKYPGELMFSQVNRFATWQQALNWCEDKPLFGFRAE